EGPQELTQARVVVDHQDVRLVGGGIHGALAVGGLHALVDSGALGGIEQAEQHLAKALDRVGAGLAAGAGRAPSRPVGQVALEFLALLSEPQPALASVSRAALLLDVALLDQILQHAADRLLGDLQDRQQMADRLSAVAADEIERAVMRAAE